MLPPVLLPTSTSIPTSSSKVSPVNNTGINSSVGISSSIPNSSLNSSPTPASSSTAAAASSSNHIYLTKRHPAPSTANNTTGVPTEATPAHRSHIHSHHHNHHNHSEMKALSSVLNQQVNPYRAVLCTVAFFIIAYFIYFLPDGDGREEISAAVEKGKKGGNPTVEKMKPDGQLCQKDDAFRYLLSPKTAARCLDGSRPAFYLKKGHGDGKNRWLVFFEGGGWCFDLKACYDRSKMHYGSSWTYPRCISKDSMKDYLSSNSHNNPFFYNWNIVQVKYCDGTSYSSDIDLSYKGTKLFFRGRHNRDETIRTLLSLGMKTASDVVIGGCSAGALGVHLGIDAMADIIHTNNTDINVRGLALSGFFNEYSAFETLPKNGIPYRDDGLLAGKLDYANALRNVFLFTNMSAGANHGCVEYYSNQHHLEAAAGSPYNIVYDRNFTYLRNESIPMYGEHSVSKEVANCAFSAKLGPHIRTPMFILQPQYDSWQVLHVLGRNNTVSTINAFGRQITEGILSNYHYKKNPITGEENNPGHASFIESCAHHCTSCSVDDDTWSGSKVSGTFLQNASLHKSSPSLAFKYWFKISTELGSNHAFDSSISGVTNTSLAHTAHNTFNRDTFLALQDAPYPCPTCCKCTVKQLPYEIVQPPKNLKGTHV